MGENSFYLPVVPKGTVNNLVVSVSHFKERKYAYISVVPCEVSDGFIRVSLSLLGGGLSKIEDMPRLNRKRLAQLLEQAQEQVKAKAGPLWDAVQKCLEREGLQLAGAAA